MANLHTDDTFMWENALIDDYDKDYAPGRRICIDDATPAEWDALGTNSKARDKIKSDGGSTAYYYLPKHATELRHLISHKGMSKSRGDIFKACYRLDEKEGADVIYDLNKMKFFVDDLIEMYHRGEKL